LQYQFFQPTGRQFIVNVGKLATPCGASGYWGTTCRDRRAIVTHITIGGVNGDGRQE
jgi:hypothetical protein